ncbi:cobalt-precorrin-5B (C(1))-methyltransferase CbiD [Proteocatella sphenisci]|uniref:cobalt-precorrin-5B (C(1))-methyltransferase CbiD n=1 Tax=Proteocatella sphenisci TaxID=181070 RepID=UPI00048AD16C|nr:cobalt-precorrin-5B (C(1))-methyltransferase CbiD [Proteocatella sphenisci]
MDMVIQGQKSLRRGYTTGSCSAAATKAALLMMMSGQRCDTVKIDTPKGIELNLEVHNQEYSPNEACCSIIKDAGDDPDATHGLHIFSKVSSPGGQHLIPPQPYEEDLDICGVTVKTYIRGGRGVGVVTRGGLSCDVGKSAINPVPRKMIIKSVKEVLDQYEADALPRFLKIEISVERGEETALKTFNPKLGIIGGISILGTSGIVEPMSEKALVDTIKTEIKQFAELYSVQRKDGAEAAVGIARLVVPPMLVCPGNYGQDYARDELGIDLEMAVKSSNYIGEMLDYSCWLGIPRILLIGHAGKLIKIAAGVMNTHSGSADARQEVIAAHSAMLGMESGAIRDIMNAISAEEMTDILLSQGSDFAKNVFESIGKKIREHIDHRTKGKIQVEFIVFTKVHGALIKSDGADEMLKDLRKHQQKQ